MQRRAETTSSVYYEKKEDAMEVQSNDGSMKFEEDEASIYRKEEVKVCGTEYV